MISDKNKKVLKIMNIIETILIFLLFFVFVISFISLLNNFNLLNLIFTIISLLMGGVDIFILWLIEFLILRKAYNRLYNDLETEKDISKIKITKTVITILIGLCVFNGRNAWLKLLGLSLSPTILVVCIVNTAIHFYLLNRN